MLVWTRLRRMATRFAILAARASAGTLPRRRIRGPRPQNPARLPPQRQRLPQGVFWLIRLLPEAAQFAGQVQHLLSDPEMAALLAAAPQAGRILRPLCRMLALPPGPAALRPAVPRPVPTTAMPPPPGRPATPTAAPGEIPGRTPPRRPLRPSRPAMVDRIVPLTRRARPA